jgi:hypothetical protein
MQQYLGCNLLEVPTYVRVADTVANATRLKETIRFWLGAAHYVQVSTAID